MGRSQAWNQEAWLLALAVTLGSLFWVLALSCKIGKMPSIRRIVGRLDTARNGVGGNLAAHKSDTYLH